MRAWYDRYLAVFTAAGRGESEPEAVVGFYAAPLLLTTDDVVVTLRTTEEVATWVDGQVSGLRAEQYDRSEMLSSDLRSLNRRTALLRAAFSRRRADGSEIGAFEVTYVVTRGTEGLRFAALALHTS